MANVGQGLTLQMVAREAAKIFADKNMVVAHLNTDRESEFERDTNGYSIGETVRVKIPPVPVTYTGATFAGGGAAPAVVEGSVNLTVDQQFHVPLTFTAKEMKLEITDFRKRFLMPAMTSLMSKVNSAFLTEIKNRTPNVVGTWGTVPATRTVWRSASSRIDNYLAPDDERCVHFSTDANDALAEANATLFHKESELTNEFSENSVGRFAEFDFYKQLSLPVHTMGAGTGYLVNGAAQTGSSLVVDTGAGALTRGTVFTLGINAVHPITGVDTGFLRQFVVTADYAGGAGSIQIFPAITPTTATAIGTVVSSPADNVALTLFGTPSQARRQNLAFHKDAFATAFVPLPVLASCEGYTATMKGVSVRVMKFGNGLTDQESTRIDVLCALPAPIRPDHSVRITE